MDQTGVTGDISFSDFAKRVADEPVFVVLGVQGSGTNLLCRVLERAFNFSLIEDGSVISKAASRLGADPAPSQIRRSYQLIRSRLAPSFIVRKTRRLIKSNADYEGLERHFDTAAIRSGADLARFVYAYGAFRLGTSRMAIKSDDIWEDLAHIADVLPRRRIILLTRDFRDNLLSVSKKDFGPIEPLNAAWYVKRQFACYEAQYRRTPPAHRYHVRYEDLLESPLSVVHELSAHFGLAPVMGGERAVEALNIRRGNVRKWNVMGERQLAHVEALLRDELTMYGYAPAAAMSGPPGAAVWMMSAASDVVKRVGQKGKRFVKRLGK
jgi:hypothetical protein